MGHLLVVIFTSVSLVLLLIFFAFVPIKLGKYTRARPRRASNPIKPTRDLTDWDEYDDPEL